MKQMIGCLIMVAGVGCASKPVGGPAAAKVEAAAELATIPGAVPRAIPEPDPAKGVPIVWVRDRYIYPQDVINGRVGHLIGPLLIDDFVAANKLEPTDEQVKRAAQSLSRVGEKNPKAGPMPEFMARGFVQQWNLDKALYEKYGGVVIFQQMNPFEPVGAYRAFFEEQQRLGRLKFYDPVQHEKFWAYYTREHPMQVKKEDVDFSRPWWEKLGEGK